jgi:fatty-acyl-CoA synthase
MYVIDWLAKQRDLRPQKTALVDLATQRSLTYRELDERTSRCAEFLAGTWKIQPGERVAVLAPNSSDYVELLYACARIGAIMVCMNWRLSVQENQGVLADSGATALVFGSDFADAARELAAAQSIEKLLCVGAPEIGIPGYEPVLAASSGRAIEMPPRAMDDTWYLLYTSGTTGKPKGVIQTYGMTFFNGVNAMMAARLSADDVFLSVLPYFHTGGLNLYLNPLLQAGATIHVMKQFDVEQTMDLLEHGVTVFFGVPAIYLFLSQHPRFAQADFSKVRAWACGGAPIADTLLQQYLAKNITICTGFGMTETGPTVFLSNEETARTKVGCVGRPVTYALTKVVDPAGNPLPANKPGELLIKGPGITPGYWNNPEATKAAFQDGWLRSGDIAYYDNEGDYYIVDRSKDMYISGGENVYPAEVENILVQIDGVAEAAVIGVADAKWGEVGKALIALKPETRLSAEAVTAFCKQRLAGYKVPRHVQFIDALPRNAVGKVSKPTLRELYGEQRG